MHHCNQQAFVFEGLGFLELVFDDIPDIYWVFSYEVHCQYLTSIDGPALLERCRVCQNILQENLPREDIKWLLLLTPIQKSCAYSQFTSPSEWNVVVHRGNITDHLLTIRIILKLGKILPQCCSGTRSLYPAWLWSFLRGVRLPSDVWWLYALACTWTGTGVAATRPPLPSGNYACIYMSFNIKWHINT